MLRRRWIVVGVVCAGLGLGIALLTTDSVDKRPERHLAKSFLLTSSAIAERFGAPVTVSYTPAGSAVSFHRDRTEGRYRFTVAGTRESGTVRVHWQSSGSDESFEVDLVELLRGGDKPEVVWQKERP